MQDSSIEPQYYVKGKQRCLPCSQVGCILNYLYIVGPFGVFCYSLVPVYFTHMPQDFCSINNESGSSSNSFISGKSRAIEEQE